MNDNIDPNDINNIISLLDGEIEKGVGRFKVTMDDSVNKGETRENYHHGRCDVGSPFSKGDFKNLCDV